MPPCLILALSFFMVGIWPLHALHVANPPLVNVDPDAFGPPHVFRPIRTENWRLLKGNPKLTDNYTQSFYSQRGQPPFKRLQDDWADKLALGKPSFTIREINFQTPSPSFNYMFPSDDSAQHQVYEQGILEPYLSYHFFLDIRDCCRSGGGHVLEVGANYGWYSLLAASTGCSVTAYEPVPWFHSLMQYNIEDLNENSLSLKIELHSGVVLGNESDADGTIAMPVKGNTFEDVPAGNVDCSSGKYVCIKVKKNTLDKASNVKKQQRVQLHNKVPEFKSCGMRVDAEGLQTQFVDGAHNYLKDHEPMVIILEMAPLLLDRFGNVTKGDLAVFDRFIQLNYIPHLVQWDTVRSYNWNIIKDNMNSHRYHGSFSQLISDCGTSCIVYLRRAGMV